MKSKSEMKCLYFWVRISIFIKNNPFFCNRTGKVFKIYSFYLACFKFDAALLNLHIPCLVYLKNLPKYFPFFLPRKLIFLLSGIFWKMHFSYFIDNRAFAYYENDVHIVNISNDNSIYHVL